MEQEPAWEDANDGREGKRRRRDGRADEVLLPAQLNGGALAIPSAGEMSVLLERVDNVDDMKNLHEAAAAWEATTKRMKRAFEEIAAIAEFRIRLERKIGPHLTQTVKRGRPTKRSARLTFSDDQAASQLPQGVNKEMARQYRKLAAVPEESLDAYLVRARESESVPSSKGLIKFAGTSGKRASVPKRGRRRSDPAPQPVAPAPAPATTRDGEAVPDMVIDAVKRFLQVDLLVGGDRAAFPKAQAVAAELLQGKQLRGDVFVAECLDPATWLPKLAAARTNGSLAQVVVVIPATPGANWFSLVEDGKWLCCFPRGSAVAVVYLGERRHGFWIAFHPIGAVLAPGYESESN